MLENYPDVCDAIRQAAAANPDAVALEGVDGGQTYRTLLQRADAVAAALAQRDVGRGALVGICMTRSTALVNAMLGVMETGAAYLPLDLSHPPARLTQILADAAPKLIITDEASAAAVRAFAKCEVITIETLMQSAPRGVQLARKKGDLAYVLHTSGSTGKPVGVEVLRDGLSNFMAAMANELTLSVADTLLAVTTIAFDIAELELLLPLTLGGRVVVADEAMLRDPRRLAARLAQGDITAMQATPATWQTLLDAGWDGARDFKALVGGERLPRALADAVAGRVETLWNLYGPTETTIWSTAALIAPDAGSVPIGRPIANTVCYIVDENLQCVADGVPGELLIGGDGVARGYLNDPERTAARFVADPVDPNGGKCFRTGDFVRRAQDGSLIYLGRRDQQVKIRGFRVELGEIEARLGAHPSVRAAAAVVHGSDLADARIGAYVVLEQGAAAEPQALVAHLKEALPSYMVPASVAIVEALPRLPNGKIDRERLAAGAVATPARREARSEPRNAVEAKLLAVLKDVLASDDVGVDDNFFEAGGTSLLGMRYLARVSDVLNVELGPADLMHAATVTSLAERIAEKTSAAAAMASAADGAPAAVGHSYWRPLPLVRAESGLARVDAAAIAYLPEEIVSSPLFKAQFAARKDDAQPFWTGIGHLASGSIALVVVPSGTRDFFADSAKAKASIDAAVAYAGRLGAQCVSLTGLIPAVTDLGRALSSRQRRDADDRPCGNGLGDGADGAVGAGIRPPQHPQPELLLRRPRRHRHRDAAHDPFLHGSSRAHHAVRRGRQARRAGEAGAGGQNRVRLPRRGPRPHDHRTAAARGLRCGCVRRRDQRAERDRGRAATARRDHRRQFIPALLRPCRGAAALPPGRRHSVRVRRLGAGPGRRQVGHRAAAGDTGICPQPHRLGAAAVRAHDHRLHPVGPAAAGQRTEADDRRSERR